MPLILAIEPDRRQAARIAALTRGQLNAELLVTESTEHAIAALASRVPDLILTSLLLSPKDESRLHEIDGGAGHVPTLMIPRLATPARRSRERPGLLKRLPWSRATPASTSDTEGCEPAVFAAQIAEYLDRAALERVALDREGSSSPTPAEQEAVAAPEDGARAATDFEEPIPPEAPPIETAVVAIAQAPAAEEALEAETPAAREAAPATEALAETGTFAEPEVLRAADVLAEEILVEAEILAEAEVSWDELSFGNETSASPIEISADTIDLRAFVQELEATMTAETAATRQDPAAHHAQPALAAIVPVGTIREAARSISARAAVAHPLPGPIQWPALEGLLADETIDEDIIEIVADFVAALEADAEPFEDEPESAWNCDPDSDLWMPLPSDAGARWPRLESACSRTRPKQDEWGFFDPEQCGFSALLAKLDQMTK